MGCLRKWGQVSTTVVHWGLFKKSNFTRTHKYVCTVGRYMFYVWNKGERNTFVCAAAKYVDSLKHFEIEDWFHRIHKIYQTKLVCVENENENDVRSI